MDQSGYPGLRGWTTPNAGAGSSPPPLPQGTFQGMPQGMYPGIGDPLSGPPAVYNPVQVLPQSIVPTTPAATPAKPGGIGKFSFQDIKGIVDRMGGIDGLLANVGKVQKLMATMQQMAPMLRLLIGKGAATAGADGSDGVKRPRKRRRRGKARSRSGRPQSRLAGTRRRR